MKRARRCSATARAPSSRRAVEDDDELVAADAPDQAAGRRLGAESLRDRYEELVAERMAVTVVDELEPVDVEEQQRDVAVTLVPLRRASG